MFGRRPPLPPSLHDAWRSFLVCAERIEAGRTVLLATLPVGRVERAPIAVGIAGLRDAINDVQGWLSSWQHQPTQELWEDCRQSLGEVLDNMPEVERIAATTSELEELLEAVNEDLVAPLDVFADVEREWGRHYRIPRELRATAATV